MSDVDATERVPGRPRRPGVSEAVLTAATDLVTAKGYAGTSIDEIARASGVAKTTIYRRWRSKGELAIDALTAALGQAPTGQASAEEALGSAISWMTGRIRQQEVRGLLLGLVAEATEDAEIRTQLRSHLRAPFADRLTNEWGLPSREVDLAFDIVVGGLLHRFAMNGRVTKADSDAFTSVATSVLFGD